MAAQLSSTLPKEGTSRKSAGVIFSLTGTGLSCQRLSLIEIRDSSGLTASDVAEQAGHKEIADLLLGEQMRMEYFE